MRIADGRRSAGLLAALAIVLGQAPALAKPSPARAASPGKAKVATKRGENAKGAATTRPTSAPASAPASTPASQASRARLMPEAARSLKVGVAGSAPFILPGAVPRGLSIDVWKALARRIGAPFQLQRYPNVRALLQAVIDKRVDVGVGPISITAERAERLDFTQPYFRAGIGLLVPVTPVSTWARVRPFLSRAFLVGSLTLLVILFLVGNLIWLVERKKNPDHFPPTYVRGVGNGMWFALVTMTTVGYGDRVPITRIGRWISGVWMLIAMVTASSLTAGIATALTLSQISGGDISSLQQLKRRRVAVVKGTPAVALARRFRTQLTVVKSKQRAIELVARKQVDAALYDYPVLQHHLAQHPNLPLTVYRTKTRGDHYGFALPRGHALRGQLDVTLLQMRETLGLRAIARRWKLGDDE